MLLSFCFTFAVFSRDEISTFQDDKQAFSVKKNPHRDKLLNSHL